MCLPTIHVPLGVIQVDLDNLGDYISKNEWFQATIDWAKTDIGGTR